MAIPLSTAASRMLATAAATATAMASGTTQAEVESLARILAILATRNDLLLPAMKLGTHATVGEITPG